MHYIRKELYDTIDEAFMKFLTLSDAYEFFYDTFEMNHSSYNAKDFVKICALLNIFNAYSGEIRSDIKNIYEQFLPEY